MLDTEGVLGASQVGVIWRANRSYTAPELFVPLDSLVKQVRRIEKVKF
jgi:hypothetical protein